MRTRISALALAAALLAASLFPSSTAAQKRAHRNQTDAPAARRLKSIDVGMRPSAPDAPAPEEVLGFRVGDDRKLASWASIVDYFKRLDAASDRVKFEELGRTTMGAPFVLATISAPENLARLSEFKEIQRQLADPRTIIKGGAGSDAKARELIARGKTIVLITCGIHSTEVGSTRSSMLIAHRLASSDDASLCAMSIEER